MTKNRDKIVIPLYKKLYLSTLNKAHMDLYFYTIIDYELQRVLWPTPLYWCEL